MAAKTGPVIIVSRFDPNPPRSLVIYVPLTTQNLKSPYEVEIPNLPFLDKTSVANVQGLASLPMVRLEKKIGVIPDAVMQEIKKALSYALDLGL